MMNESAHSQSQTFNIPPITFDGGKVLTDLSQSVVLAQHSSRGTICHNPAACLPKQVLDHVASHRHVAQPARKVMLACLSPCDAHYEESLTALRYAERVKRIRTRAVADLHDGGDGRGSAADQGEVIQRSVSQPLVHSEARWQKWGTCQVRVEREYLVSRELPCTSV